MHLFRLTLQPDAQALLRVLGLFAQRQIVPQSVTCRTQEKGLMVEIEVADLYDHGPQILAAKLQQLVLVVDCDYGCRPVHLAA